MAAKWKWHPRRRRQPACETNWPRCIFDTIKIRTFLARAAALCSIRIAACPATLAADSWRGRSVLGSSGRTIGDRDGPSRMADAADRRACRRNARLVGRRARSPWSRQIHGFYRTMGRGVTWPIRAAWDAVAGPGEDPLVAFHRQEREAVVSAVEKLLDELSRLAQVGNEILRPRLERLLGGRARTELLEQVEAAHAQLPAVDEDYRAFLRAELDAWKAANPPAVRFLQTLDHAMAVARPAITISLFVSGWVFAGDLVGQAAVHAVGHTAGQIATEAAIAGGITGGGEAIVSTTSEGVRQAAARLFRRLQSRYAQQRAQWLAGFLERDLLGNLLADLRQGAEVPESAAFCETLAAVEGLAGAVGSRR